MFTTILVPLDGSSRAETALPVAARIAHHTGATLVLVRVVTFISEYWPAVMTAPPALAEAVVETDLAEATAYLEQVASSPELADLPVKTTVLSGSTAPTILEAATASKSDLIVLCSHGSTGMVRWMMGSVAEKIARYASVPVLVLHEGATHLNQSPVDVAQPLRLLVPLDGSIASNAALEPGASLLTALAAPGQKVALHLAHVLQPSHVKGVNSPHILSNSSELSQSKQFLSQTARFIQQGSFAPSIVQQHLPVTWSVTLDTDVASALLRIAEQGEEAEGAGVFGGCELIAISTHGQTSFQHWVMGSITERMLSATKRPILIVHPKEEAIARS